ncbi:MAG TPA: FAD binding domain-containing protein [Candidatus Methylomirabilis sp.]|nr:FAD binding domain-containing protein [Candidatus Methylomirabilis sp.]
MLRPFALHRPRSLHGVSDLLVEHRGDSAIYAGGTELLLLLKEGVLRVRNLIDVKRVPGLGEITIEDGHVVIGATVTHRAAERSDALRAACPIVPAVARHVANVRVRNAGTVGGNLAFADPHSDLATLFLTLDGSVRLWRPGEEREMPLAEFVRGPYETARQEDEILTSVRLHPWPAGTVAAYVKFGMYERPTLGIALALTLDPETRSVADARVAVGCVGPRPERLSVAEDLARGRELTDVLADAERLATVAADSVDPADDLHGSADYKRDMTRVFLRRALQIVGARAMGRETRARYYPHTVVVTSASRSVPSGISPGGGRRATMAVTAKEPPGAPRAADGDGPRDVAAGRAASRSVACRVNGQAVAVEVPAHALLLDVLRDRLGLKGAKRSCDVQVCGACTVLVDGAPVSACTYLAVEIDGREVATVEGLAAVGGLHPLQESFLEHGAVQCGFCTSGMLMTGCALLDEEPAPSPERVAAYLRGNLCRCTGYRKVVEAIVACGQPTGARS